MAELDTPYGPARVAVDTPTRRSGAVSLLVLGHGAGGGVDAPDLIAVTEAALRAGVVVARVTQPHRVAGRRAPAPAAQLDAAWRAVVTGLCADPALAGLPLIVGGRSTGARVACRTAGSLRAAGIVALAFPASARATGAVPGSRTRRRRRPHPRGQRGPRSVRRAAGRWAGGGVCAPRRAARSAA